MKVLKIGAIWCKECLVMRPMWEEIEAATPGLQTEYFESDEHPELLKKYAIETIPTFIFLGNDGQEILRLSGMQNKDELMKVIKDNLDR